MNWFYFALLATIVYSIAEIIGKYVTNEESEPVYIGLLSAFFSAIVAFSIAIFRHDIWYHLTVLNVMGLFASSFVTSVGIITYFKSLQLSDVSEFVLFIRTQVLFVFVGGIIIFSDRFTQSQLFGIIAMAIGIIVISISKTKIKLHKGNILAIVTAILFGIGVFIDKAIVNDFSATLYSALYYGLNTLFLLIPAFFAYKQKKKFPSIKSSLFLFVTGTFYVLSAIWSFTAYQMGGMVSLMTIIAQLQIPILVLYGLFVFKERDRIPQKILSMICMGIGAYLLSV
ncbi:MAG: hypothetical protein ACD_48C00323G0002 [uncultured bacterium]|nr:MAG: hypothetical protein ACD_48C00323G0002 [uncultured bacterium]